MGSTKRSIDSDSDWEFKYTPRPFMVAFHQRKERFAHLLLARRSGKSLGSVCELVIRAMYTKKHRAQYHYICPFRSQAKSVAWAYLKEYTEGIAVDVRESELSVELPNGAKIFLTGSDNVDALRGLYSDGVILDEYADCRAGLLDAVVMPLLMDRLGFLVICGTSRGRVNDFYDKYQLAKDNPDWFQLEKNVYEAGVIHPEEIERMKRSISDAKFEQEMMCSFDASLVGTYYADNINEIQQKGHLLTGDDALAMHDYKLPVHCAMDLGRRDSTVIIFWQETPTGINVIDHYANNGEQAQHYIDNLNGRPYALETVWIPHDGVAKTFSTHKSALEQFLEAGLNAQIVPKLSVQDGIEATRQVLGYTHFNYDSCFALVENLRVYRKRYDELNRCFSDKPLHDFASDFADAVRYMAIVANPKLKQLKLTDKVEAAVAKSYEYNLDQLFKQRENEHNTRTATSKMRI